MKKKLSLLCTLLLLFCSFQADQVITIFMIGDSTMSIKNLKSGNPERGWGHVLPGFFTSDIVIDNHAANGQSTKSFIDEGRLDKVISQVKKGDYVFIQFGHNDAKSEDPARYTIPGGTYNKNLTRFVNETRSKGGIPVIFSSIVRRNFDENGKLVDTHGAYLTAARQVASELNVLFIDLNKGSHELVEQTGVEASKALFMWVPEKTLAFAPEGKEDNTHLNIYGARRIASLAVDSIANRIPELAPYIRKYDFVVAQDGSGDFFTIQEAINAVPDFRKEGRTTILIRKGNYKEKLIVPESKIYVSLIGEDGATLTYDDYATKTNIFGEDKSTSGSATCYIYGHNFYAENITFENSSGPVGQAVAAFVNGDRAAFKKCRFLGFQDTLYTYGDRSRQYYEDCYIEGSIDFIFGWSTTVFNRCEIHSNKNGFVTAPSTNEGKEYGYVFFDCKLTAAEGVDKVYLSRPWRPFAKAVFIRCNLGSHIVPAGWDNWNKKEADQTVFYAEYQSTGPGAHPTARAPYSHQLTSLEDYTIEKILAGNDGWNPIADPQSLIMEKK